MEGHFTKQLTTALPQERQGRERQGKTEVSQTAGDMATEGTVGSWAGSQTEGHEWGEW